MGTDLIDELIKSIYSTKENLLSSRKDIIALSNKIKMQILNNKRIIIFGTGISSEILDKLTKTLWTSFKISEEQFCSFVVRKPEEMQKRESVEWYESVAVVNLSNINLNKSDLVIGISSSGSSSYVHRGLKFAKELHCSTAAIMGQQKKEYGNYIDLLINIKNHHKVIWALNAEIESSFLEMAIFDVMVYQALQDAGRIYKDHLPFLNPISQRLYDMCIKTITELTNINEDAAIQQMEQNHNKLESTLIAVTYNVSFEETEKILKLNKNNFNIIMDPKKIKR